MSPERRGKEMEFREADLPCIGKKFSVTTSSGDIISVIVHISGRREIFYFEADYHDEPLCDIVLSEEESKQIGSVLMGTYFQPVQDNKTELSFKDLVIEWVKIDKNSGLKDRPIKELLNKNDIHVVSLIMEESTINNPGPDVFVKEGNTIVMAGKREEIEKFYHEFQPFCEIQR